MSKYFGNDFGDYFSLPNKGRFKTYKAKEIKLSVQDKIRNEELKLQEMGITPPPESNRSMLDRIFDAAQIGQYASLGALKNLTDKDKSTTVLQGIIGGLRAGNPFGRGYEQGEASMSDVLDNLGWKYSGKKPQYKYFNERLGVDIDSTTYATSDIARFITSFIGDIVLDPTTYFSFGLIPALRKMLQGTTKSVVKSVGQESVEKGVKKVLDELAEGKGKLILDKLGLDSSDEVVSAINNSIKRFAKIDKPVDARDLTLGTKKHNVTLLKDKSIREFGDKTVAPYFNKATHAINENKYFQAFKDKFTAQQILDNRKLLMSNPEELFKQKAFKQYAYKIATDFKNKQFMFAEEAAKLFEDFSPSTQRLMTDIMEDSKYWKNIDVITESENIVRMSENAQRMKDNLLKMKAETEGLLNKYTQLEGFETKIQDAKNLLNKIDKIMSTTDFDFMDIIKNMDDNASIIKQAPRDKVQRFMNDKLFDETSVIAEKLVKNGLYKEDEAYDVAVQIRASLDADLRNVPLDDRKMYKGQIDIPRIERVEGVEYTNDEIKEMLRRKREGLPLNDNPQPTKKLSKFEIMQERIALQEDIKRSREARMKKKINTPPKQEKFIPTGDKAVDEATLRKLAGYNLNNGVSQMKVRQALLQYVDEKTAADIMNDARFANVYESEVSKIIDKETALEYSQAQKNTKKELASLKNENASHHKRRKAELLNEKDYDNMMLNDAIGKSNKAIRDRYDTALYDNELYDDFYKKQNESKFVDDVNYERQQPKFQENKTMEKLITQHIELIENTPKDKKINLEKFIERYNKDNGTFITPQQYRDYVMYRKGYAEVGAGKVDYDLQLLNALKTADTYDRMPYINKITNKLKEIKGKPNEQSLYKHFRNEIEQAVGKKDSDDLFKEAVDRMKNPQKYINEMDYTPSDLRGIAPESTNRVNAQIELANQKEPTTLITFDVDENLSKTDTPQGRIYGDTPKGDILEGMKSNKQYVQTNDMETVRQYNMQGINVTEPLKSTQVVKPSFINNAIKYINRINPNFSAVLDGITVRLLDLDAAEKATIKFSTNEIMFPNNKIYDNMKNIEEFVSEQLFTHESAHKFQKVLNINNNAWAKIMQKDKAQLFSKGVDVAEDFAESFKLFVKNSSKFADKYPERFEAMRKYIEAFNRNPENVVDEWVEKLANKRSAIADQATKQIPKTAEQTVKAKEQLLTIQKEKVLKAIGDNAISKEEAIERLKQIDYDLESENFEKAFSEAFPRDKIWENVTVDKKTQKRVLSDEALENLPIDEQAKHVMQVVKDNLKTWGITENIDKPLDDYVTHILKTAKHPDIPGATRKQFYNPYNLKRKHNATIKEFNSFVKEKYGIDEAFETLLGKIYMERGLRHNQLIFEKDFIEKFVDLFGDRIDDLNVKHTGKRLFASTSDVIDAIGGIDTMGVEDALKGLDISSSLKTRIIKAANIIGIENADDVKILADMFELSDEQYEQLLDGINKFDQSRRSEMLKQYGLPTSLLDAFDISKGKFSLKPVVELPERTFLLLKDKNKKFSAFTMSDASITMLNDMGKMQMDDIRSTALKVYDKFLHLWKLNNTAVNLGFHGRNALSNQFNNYLATGVESLKPETQMEAIKVLRLYGKDSTKNAIKNIGIDDGINVNGKFISYQEISNQFDALNLRNEGAFTKDLYDESPNAFKEITDIVRGNGKPNISFNPIDDKNFFAYKAGRAIGADVENVARMSNFIAQLKQGKDFYEAAEQVNKFLFDYSDLSEFEKTWMKRIIPFYTWMRKNIPLQWEQLIEQPQVYRTIAKATQNIRNMTPEKERLKDKDVNEFARDWIQLPFKVKGSSGNKEPVFWNPNLPYQDLSKGPSDLISSLTPAIKLPIEIATNYNWYFKSPISRGVGDTENAPGYMQFLMNQMDDPRTEKNEAMQMNPKVRHILRSLASGENASKLIEQHGVDKLISALNAIAGIKLYSYDADKYKQYALRDRLKVLQDLRRREEEKRSDE